MSDLKKLLADASSSMAIIKGEKESVENWKLRVLYSAIGRTGYASLWDVSDEESISKIRFTNRINELLKGWLSVYPELRSKIRISADDYYAVLKNSGVIYDSSYRVQPSREVVCRYGGCTFVRSPLLGRNVSYSGLGAYTLAKDIQGISLYEGFNIDEHSLNDIARHYLSNLKFRKLENDSSMEYLLLNPPFTRGYWKTTPDKDGCISIMRTADPENKIYYFYKYDDGQCYISQIADGLVSKGQYRYLSSALLKEYDHLPEIRYTVDGSIVTVELQYLLPPADLDFLVLYSWPKSFHNIGSLFKRIVSVECFQEIKDLLIKKGYILQEVKV